MKNHTDNPLPETASKPPQAPQPYDCQACGACCSYKASWPVLRRDRSDAAKLPQGIVRDDLPLLKTHPVTNKCCALVGEVGKDCACFFYANRPDACRNFKPGSVLCHEARAHFNLPILPEPI